MNNTLLDTIHKCLRCEAPAYEVKENEYRCSECDFTWEVYICEADEEY